MSDLHLAGINGATGPLLDVRNHNVHGESDEEVKDIYAYGAGLHSTKAIIGLSDFTNLQTLSLHGNQIERIEGLEVLHQLVTLNLSSNRITWMEGLSQLKSLRVLNLSNNRIRDIAGLQGLVAIRTLILSHNEISLLGGLSALQGLPYALQHLDLRDNLVEYLCELWILGGCSHLEEVVFQCGGYANPVCKASEYRPTLLSVIPRLSSLDGSSCVDDQGPVSNVDSVPSLWAIHHSYPGHLTDHVNPGHKTLGPLRGYSNVVSCNPCTGPTIHLQDAHAEGPGRQSSNGCKYDTRAVWGNSCEKGYKPQDQFQKPESYNALSHKSSHPESDSYQVHNMLRSHDPFGNQRQGVRESAHANTQNLTFVEDYDVPLRKENGEHEVVSGRHGSPVLDPEAQHPHATMFKDKFRGNGISNNVRTRSKPNDQEELDISFTGAGAGADVSRYVRFVDQNSKLPLVHQDKTSFTTRELATQTESVRELATQTESTAGLILDQACQEVNHVQAKLSSITVMIDGNSPFTGIEKPHFLASLDFHKKDNELLNFFKEKKLLEEEFAAFKILVDQERKNWQVDDEHKSLTLTSLEMNLKSCKVELKNLQRTVAQTERKLIAEVKHVESTIASEETLKLSALNAEILTSKEALKSALNACQTVGTALNDANHQKERAKRTLVSLTAALDEQRSKVKMVAEMLENCTHQERRSRRECSRLKEELDLVCQELRKKRDCEPGVLIREESALWEARGREEAEKESQQWADKLHQRLVIIQTMFCLFQQENAKTLSSMSKLRDMMNEKMLELRKAIEAVIEKERGGEELITELSYVVSAQKMRSERMQHDLAYLADSKQEVEHLRGEILRLRETICATEQKAAEVEALKCEFANVTSIAERERRSLEEATCIRFSSLSNENEKLTARASSLAYKLQETEDIIKTRTEVCDSQEAIIQQLENELVEAKNVARMLETNIKVLEADLVQRLHHEVEQKYELRTEVTSQETIIVEMEEELKLMKSAKCAAENACKSLQQKVKDVDLLLRHVDVEISSVKTLYEGREKSISLERDNALAKVKAMQKKLEDAESAAAAAMQAHFESTKLMETKEHKTTTALIQKDIHIEELKRKLLELEAELHSRDLALETQKAISAAKVEQLGKVLEELREVT